MWWRTHASLRFATRTFATQASENMEVVYRRHGSPTAVLEARKGADATAEAFGPFDVAVRWLAAPINPADVNMIQGTYPIKPELPAIGGNEGVAVVERAGAEVQSFQEGDWVIPRAPGLGTWRNHSVHNYQHFMRVPSDLPVSQVATASINPCTALRLLTDFAELKEGDVVVQNGGNSSVGRCVIQLAAARGIKTVNLVRERYVHPICACSSDPDGYALFMVTGMRKQEQTFTIFRLKDCIPVFMSCLYSDQTLQGKKRLWLEHHADILCSPLV